MALTLLAANNAQTVLASGINSTATTLTVNTGTGNLFPSPVAGTSFFKLTLVDSATGLLTEIVHVTARTGDTMTIERGQEGTIPRAWSANDILANMMTAGTLSYILGNFQPLDPTLTALSALVGVANKLPYFNGDDTADLADLTQVGRDIIGKGDIADVIQYLGLGDAASRDVGTGTNQIPDMSTFTYSTSGGISIYRFPNRMCVQRGNSSTDSSGGAVVSLPVAMTEFTPIIVEGLVSNWTGTGNVYDFFTVYGAQGTTTTTFLAKSASYRGIDGKFIAQSTNFNWIAIGTI
ncbi:hypothetical protein B9P82_00155 [Citrobacter sp. L55]|uniref:hypothetical protein n=1 Tax=Citrobacter sp. L55 TaxID=1981983 RepID=UPI000C76848E|nr:hypothetical protein [Citrobacter sp. L55]PLC66091.1 hypothetical protein B9P82_00155 [Citrobacter sp. L55]